jgi:hypothetical protein
MLKAKGKCVPFRRAARAKQAKISSANREFLFRQSTDLAGAVKCFLFLIDAQTFVGTPRRAEPND